jgi:hypothetical protein
MGSALSLPPVAISVNISALEFGHKGFLAGVRAILAETGLQRSISSSN